MNTTFYPSFWRHFFRGRQFLNQRIHRMGFIFVAFSLLSHPSLAATPVNPDRITAAHLMNNLIDASWVQDGSGNKIVYLFFDPNCPYCHIVYDTLAKIRKDLPDIQFRWVPLATLGGTSEGKAAAIIQAQDPLAAFHQSERNYGFLDSDNGGGIKPARIVKAATKSLLDENLSIIEGENLAGIPIVVFQATDGKPFYFMGQRTEAQLRQILSFVAAGNFGGGTPIKSQ